MKAKINWADAPYWAQYWAMDADGYAYWYERIPNIDVSDGVWTPAIEVSMEDMCLTEFLCDAAKDYGFDPAHWTTSLVERESSDTGEDPKKAEPRPGAHIWKAWAEGKTVQRKAYNLVMEREGDPEFIWEDDDPRTHYRFGPDKKPQDWRVKPTSKRLRYRFALIRKFDLITEKWVYNPDVLTSEDYEKETEEREDFYGWLTEWITVEVEE